MPRKGGRRKKTRTHVVEGPGTGEKDTTPRSFVFKMGKVPPIIQSLVIDFRQVMSPYTATNLREKRKNTLKDFIHVGAPMGITHFMFFTHTETGTNFKIARIPRGPTLSFKVVGYSLMRQLHVLHKRPVDASLAMKSNPLVVLNNFNSTQDHIKLMNATFQHMFPAIDVQTIKLSDCRRVVLFNYEQESDTIEFRQYVIRAAPVGVSKSVKTIVKAKIPNLGQLNDISEFLLGKNTGSVQYASDSEIDDETAHVTMPSDFRGRGNQKAEKSAIRLAEIGPRLQLKLTKVEREICEGDVLYHAHITKSAEESAKAKAKREAALSLKRKRREEQEANVTKKKDIKEAKKQRKAERKAAREDRDDDQTTTTGLKNDTDSDMDDAAYYRQEVGEEPDEYMFPSTDEKRKREQNQKNKENNQIQAPSSVAPSDRRRKFMAMKTGKSTMPKGRVIRKR